MRSGNDNFVSAHGFSDAFDVKGKALVQVIALGLALLLRRHHRLRAADIHNDVGSVKAKHHAGHNGADFGLIISQHCLLFCFPDALEDDLFGGLGGNAAKARRRDVFAVFEDFCLAGIGIKLNYELFEFCHAVVFAIGGQNRDFDGFQHHVNVYTAFRGYLV